MKLFTTLLFAGIVALSSCSSPAGSNNNATEKKNDSLPAAQVYSCPMHPEVTSDKPGSCSKCGMDLEKK